MPQALTLSDLQRMGEESIRKDPADTLEAQLALSVHVKALRKMRLALVNQPLAQAKIAQACQKLTAAAKALNAQ